MIRAPRWYHGSRWGHLRATSRGNQELSPGMVRLAWTILSSLPADTMRHAEYCEKTSTSPLRFFRCPSKSSQMALPPFAGVLGRARPSGSAALTVALKVENDAIWTQNCVRRSVAAEDTSRS